MPYRRDIYLKAERILEKRREASELELEARVSEIKDSVPEINEIQQQLSRIGLEISKIFFYKGDTQIKLDELRAKSKALCTQRAEILKNHGYSENAMSREFVCPACEDRGFINNRMCKCHLDLLKKIMRDEVQALAPLDDCTFDNFELEYYSDVPLENSVVPRARAEKALEACRRYAQNFSTDSKNLMFMGGTGLGKTHLSLAIANVVINKGYYVCYGTSQNICEDLRAEMFGRDDKITYTKEMVCECDLLVLDDLGTEIENQYNISNLYNIINTRILAKKPTIISTNYDMNYLEEVYDKRITSRISGEYTKIMLFGTDNRLK